jgi:hypothetical protein
MANPRGNSDIAIYGEPTRFVQVNKAAVGVATFRKQLRDVQRRMLAMPCDPDETLTVPNILRQLAADGRYTLAHYTAANRLIRSLAMDGRSEAAIQAMENDVCGKLPNANR